MSAIVLKLPFRDEGDQEPTRKAFSPLRWLWASIEAERSRLILWLPVFAGVGIAAYFALPAEPPLVVGLVLSALVAGLAGLVPVPLRALVLVPVIAIAVGFLAAQLRTRAVAAPVLSHEIDYATVVGTVRWREPLDDGRLRLVLEDVTIKKVKAADTPERIRLTLRGVTASPEIGDRIEAKASLSPPPGPVAPHAYDFARVAWFQGIGAVGFGGNRLSVMVPATHSIHWLGRWFASLRARIQDRIADTLPPREAAIASALLIGARGAIRDSDVAAMRAAGLAHVLAISGLHLGLVAGLVFFFVRGALALVEPLALRWPLKKIAALVALLTTAFYLGLSGGSVSTQRSFIMLSVAMLAILIDRPALTLRTVAFAAALILLWSPEALMSPSFQMSFAAVLALVAFYEWQRDRPRADDTHPWPRPAAYVAGVFVTTLIAQIAVGPFAVYHFNQFQTFGLLGNEIVVPLLAFLIMPAGILALLTMPFGLEAWPLKAMGWGIDQVLAAAHFTAHLPAAVATFHAWPVAALGLTTIGGLWLCLWQRWWRLAGLPVAILGLLVGFASPGPDVLIGQDGKHIAFRVKGSNGWSYGLIGTRASSFRGEVWLKQIGTAPGTPLQTAQLIKCDALGCVVPGGVGGHFSLVRDGRALAEECENAQVLISLVRVPATCMKPQVVLDPLRLHHTGPVALRFNHHAQNVRMAHVQTRRRPWQNGAGLAGDDDD